MKNKLEIPIGVTAEIFGKKVECKEFEVMPCDGCTFNEDDFLCCENIACYANERDDKKYIIFKELKE